MKRELFHDCGLDKKGNKGGVDVLEICLNELKHKIRDVTAVYFKMGHSIFTAVYFKMGHSIFNFKIELE